jgi:hypothetical protein
MPFAKEWTQSCFFPGFLPDALLPGGHDPCFKRLSKPLGMRMVERP